MKKFLLYWLRWLASTPILALSTFLLSAAIGDFWAAFVANSIGACIFFWVDKIIFKEDKCSTSSAKS